MIPTDNCLFVLEKKNADKKAAYFLSYETYLIWNLAFVIK